VRRVLQIVSNPSLVAAAFQQPNLLPERRQLVGERAAAGASSDNDHIIVGGRRHGGRSVYWNGLGERGGFLQGREAGLVSPLCSRNARPWKTLVRRGQWGNNLGHHWYMDNERAWKENLYWRSLG
jgi:hypothetical protein